MELHFNLKQKLLFGVMATALFILFVYSFFIYRQSAETIRRNYSNSVSSSLNVSAAAFDDLMREAYFVAVNTANSTDLADAIAQEDKAELEDFLERYLTGNIDSIYCYLNEEKHLIHVTKQGTTAERCSTEERQWIDRMVDSVDNPLMPISMADQLSSVKKQVFLFIQPILSENGKQVIGQIIATVDERTVYFNCLESGQAGQNGHTYITTPEGNFASCANLNNLGKPETEEAENQIKISVRAPLSGYGFHSVSNQDVIVQDLRRTRLSMIRVAGLIILVAAILFWLLLRSVLLPLQNLEKSMARVGEGDLTARATVYHLDEIGRLSMGFNRMVKQLDTLIGELVTQKMLKKEAEIEALQYQIQPHFMYNTLNTIKFAAMLQGAKGIGELLEAFIELLQLTASNRGAFIPLEREIHMVKNYVKLQLFRYANSFEVEYDITPETKDCYVPSLFIQPLVENAILHGIDLKKPGGRIVISAMLIADSLVIHVKDNGRGMSAEELGKLMSGQQRSKFSGIGVGNVRERLALYYGQNAELHYYSDPGVGTTAMLVLPISHDENEYSI